MYKNLYLICSMFKKASEDDKVLKWIKDVIPTIVRHWIIVPGEIKKCGTVSNAIVQLARQSGFKAILKNEPGHFVAYVADTDSDGAYRIDATHLQFKFKHGGSLRDYGHIETDEAKEEYNKMKELFKSLERNPLQAVQIEFMPNIKIDEDNGPIDEDIVKSYNFAKRLENMVDTDPQRYKMLSEQDPEIYPPAYLAMID